MICRRPGARRSRRMTTSQIALEHHVGQRPTPRASTAAGRIRRGTEQQHRGSRRDRGLAAGRASSLKSFASRGLDDHRLRAGQLHQLRIADPIRRGNDDFVARIAKRREHIVQRMLGAVRDDDLIRRVFQSVRWPDTAWRSPSTRECRWRPCSAYGRPAWRPRPPGKYAPAW